VKLGPYQLPGVVVGDCRDLLDTLPADSVHCVVTSPPYWGLRDYGEDGQIGLEATHAEYLEAMVGVFRQVRQVLRPDGTCWVNLGDRYATGGRGGGGSYMAERGDASWQRNRNLNGWRSAPEGFKHKDLMGMPWRVAFALQADGWILRSDIVWFKTNSMPESVVDRPTKAHEYVFLLTKRPKYYYDADAILEPLSPKTRTTYGTHRRRLGNDSTGQVKADNMGRDLPLRTAKLNPDGTVAGANKRTVWPIGVGRDPAAAGHYATMPQKLVEPCILAGCPPKGIVLDPFMGTGTVGQVAERHGRYWLGFEISPTYAEKTKRRTRQASLLLEMKDPPESEDDGA
jgi:DNA modification methylase